MEEAVGGHDPSPEQLIRDWQAGLRREETFRALFEQFRSPIANFFLNRGFSAEEARELTQDTFARVYRGMAAFRFESGVATWIFRIAKNLWFNTRRDRHALRRSGQEVPLQEELDPQPVEDSSASPAPAKWTHAPQLEELLVEERHRLLRDAVASLTPKERRVALLVLQDRDYAEIALILRIPVGTVKSRMAAARRRLRELLAGHYPDFSL